MSFDIFEINAAIEPSKIPADVDEIDLPQLDSEVRIGIGRDGSGCFVFVGPGQPTASMLEGRQFRFDPWTDLVDRRSRALEDVCVLRFRADEEDVDVRDAVAAVFLGLGELARATPAALGDAIEAMKGLFEAGLKSRVDREVEIGLAGELLVLADSTDPSTLLNMWHTNADGLFDFSAQGERLDVKTTTGTERVHWFSSTQVAHIPGACTSFVSVQLPLVESGSTVSSVFATLENLDPGETARVRSIIIDTAKVPPEVLTSVVFDRTAARASMIHVPRETVPAPLTAPGVGRMRWEALLDRAMPGPAGTCEFASRLGF